MNHNALKALAEAAVKAHDDANARLVARGLNSKARYPLLKDLREAKDAAWGAYVKGAKKFVRKELDKVIAAGRPAKTAAELARSPWKSAKAAAAAAKAAA